MDVEHCLPVLLKRPGAFPYARLVRQWQMPRVYRNFLEALSKNHNGDGPRLFLQVLYLGRSFGRENVETAMEQATSEGRADVERIRQLLTQEDMALPARDSRLLQRTRVVLPDLAQFDLLRHPETAARRLSNG